nr:hypothetical protein [Tanacetum cinerariifolium]
TVMDDQEDASKQRGKIAKINADEDVILEDVTAELEKDVEVKKNADAQGRLEESQAQVYHIDLEHADKVLSMQDDEPDPVELKEVIEVVTTAKLMTDFITAAATTTAFTITAAPTGFRMDFFRGLSYDDIRPIFEKYFNSNVAFLEKTKEQLEEEESRALKRQSESSEQQAAKKQKLDEETSNTLYNAIMETGGKDHPPMLASGNYVQWKSIIKRYIDTKPNHELIHYCFKNAPYKYQWADKDVPVSKGSTETTTERYMENYKNVS